ncbi:TonB-dependent receptor domain-containing protein [Altericroceibacterium spongiae]|nr:TonB-dependent receptor [Altericroceibacterium spongiae]
MEFSIPASRLSEALKQFAIQSGEQILVPSELGRNVKSAGVVGQFSQEEALKRVLAGTGYKAVRSGSGVISFQKAAPAPSPAPQYRTASQPMARNAAPQDRTTLVEKDTDQIGANEIIVTARKRGESDLEVPIAIQAFDSAQLARRGVQSLSDIAAVTPSLVVSESFGSLGGTMNLRGVGASSVNAATDQAVALNIDGVTIATGAAARFAQFDLQRVEVLQGPQSLYFGKNTTAGIISVISADPTDEPYAMLRGGYTFQSRGLLTEAVLSGPVTDNLAARLAFFRSDQKGYFRNPLASTTVTPPQSLIDLYGPLLAPRYSRGPDALNTGLRGTVKFEPTDDLSIRLKATYFNQKGSPSNNNTQLYFCPAGVPAPGNPGNVPGIGECEVDHVLGPTGQNPTAETAGDLRFYDGQPYTDSTQYLLSADAEYVLSDSLTLNSVTGYYDMDMLDSTNSSFSPYPAIGGLNEVKRDDFTQELRLTSDFDSPLNGMIGAYYQTGDFFISVPVTLLQDPVPISEYYIDSRTWAVFGELTYDLFEDAVQISAGGRYTDEKKDLKLFSRVLDDFADDLPADTVRTKNFSPEVTLTWRPDQRTNVFLTYKKGTKSGGFNSDTLNLPPFDEDDISYSDEKVEGIEGGVKSVLFGGALRVNLTGYAYKYDDLQVGVLDPVAVTQLTRNAASAKVRGIQFDANYQPTSIPGFKLSGAVNYSHARFDDYIGQCYTGQTIDAGCNLDINGDPVAPGAVAVNQSFSGHPLVKAPDWTGSLSADYEFPVTQDTSIGLSVAASYSSEYHTVDTQPVNSLQPEYVNLDAQIRLFKDDNGWELALIGKNLTDVLRVQQGVEVPFTPGPDVVAGTGTAGPGIPADLVGFTNPPFQLMVRLTIEPYSLFGR